MAMRDHRDTRLLVTGVSSTVRKADLLHEFLQYGDINHYFLAYYPPCYAYVGYHDSRDASEAVRDMDGRYINGMKIRVQFDNTHLYKKPFYARPRPPRRMAFRNSRDWRSPVRKCSRFPPQTPPWVKRSSFYCHDDRIRDCRPNYMGPVHKSSKRKRSRSTSSESRESMCGRRNVSNSDQHIEVPHDCSDTMLRVSGFGRHSLSKTDIGREFDKYGNIRNIWVAPFDQDYAFVDYFEPNDAIRAVRYLNGKRLFGSKFRVCVKFAVFGEVEKSLADIRKRGWKPQHSDNSSQSSYCHKDLVASSNTASSSNGRHPRDRHRSSSSSSSSSSRSSEQSRSESPLYMNDIDSPYQPNKRSKLSMNSPGPGDKNRPDTPMYMNDVQSPYQPKKRVKLSPTRQSGLETPLYMNDISSPYQPKRKVILSESERSSGSPARQPHMFYHEYRSAKLEVGDGISPRSPTPNECSPRASPSPQKYSLPIPCTETEKTTVKSPLKLRRIKTEPKSPSDKDIVRSCLEREYQTRRELDELLKDYPTCTLSPPPPEVDLKLPDFFGRI